MDYIEDEYEEAPRFTLTQQQLFDRLVVLISQQLTLAKDISQLKKDAKFNKKTNPAGIPIVEIGLVVASAKLRAQEQFEEFTHKAAQVTAKFKELTAYDEE